jgi:hypothetical protein
MVPLLTPGPEHVAGEPAAVVAEAAAVVADAPAVVAVDDDFLLLLQAAPLIAAMAATMTSAGFPRRKNMF